MISAGVATNLPDAIGYRSGERREMRPFLPTLAPGSRILEIGCGEARFSKYLCDIHEVWGVEPNDQAANVARGSLKYVLVGTFEEIEDQLPRAYFDLVICNDVIEHMAGHEIFLQKIKRHMKENSLMVGSIPNVRHYENLFNLIFGADWDYQDFGIRDRTHLRFFTEKSLRRCLERASFNVEILQGINKSYPSGGGRRGLVERIFVWGLLFSSLWRAEDILFLQFGFRARPGADSPRTEAKNPSA